MLLGTQCWEQVAAAAADTTEFGCSSMIFIISVYTICSSVLCCYHANSTSFVRWGLFFVSFLLYFHDVFFWSITVLHLWPYHCTFRNCNLNSRKEEKKSNELRSGDLAGHRKEPSAQMRRSQHVAFKYRHEALPRALSYSYTLDGTWAMELFPTCGCAAHRDNSRFVH
jgi:hypothetical protein